MISAIKFDFLKVFFVILFIITMASGILGGEEEASIIARKTFVKNGENKNPIFVKGEIYFVINPATDNIC